MATNVLNKCSALASLSIVSRSVSSFSSNTASDDCLCNSFPSEGGFEIFPDTGTEYFNDFKIISEDRFNHKAEFTRSKFFRKSMRSYIEIVKYCTGSDLTIQEAEAGYKKLKRKYPFFKKSDDQSDNTDYSKICMRIISNCNQYSFGLFNRIFNNNEDLITVYKFEKDIGFWGYFFNGDFVTFKSIEGMYHGLAMDNFLKIHNVLDRRNYYPELSQIGYRFDFFRHIAFVMMLHEIAEGHFAQNLNFYKSKAEYAEIRHFVQSRDTYVAAHLMALKAQAKELDVDMFIGKWINMDEREGEGPEFEYHSFRGMNSAGGINGASCLITYKKRGNKYVKCTYAFRIKNNKFYNERSAPGRRWDNTFGCVMEVSPGVPTIMTGIIDIRTFNNEITNYIEDLNRDRAPLDATQIPV